MHGVLNLDEIKKEKAKRCSGVCTGSSTRILQRPIFGRVVPVRWMYVVVVDFFVWLHVVGPTCQCQLFEFFGNRMFYFIDSFPHFFHFAFPFLFCRSLLVSSW